MINNDLTRLAKTEFLDAAVVAAIFRTDLRPAHVVLVVCVYVCVRACVCVRPPRWSPLL